MRILTQKKYIACSLLLGTLGAFAGLLGVQAFNRHLLMNLPVPVRMLCMITSYWLIGLVPLAVLTFTGDNLRGYGFSRHRLGTQIMVGLLIGVCMSLVLTLVPILAGLGDWVSRGRDYHHLWQFAYDFLYFITAVGLVEEFVFRGFVFTLSKRLFSSATAAIVLSSVLFGLFHFMGGSWVQMLTTGIIGAIFCICREEIPHCSLLSLSIAHGIYDAMITVWEFIF